MDPEKANAVDEAQPAAQEMATKPNPAT